jgi:polar amino acid transport system substrate-binding protein
MPTRPRAPRDTETTIEGTVLALLAAACIGLPGLPLRVAVNTSNPNNGPVASKLAPAIGKKLQMRLEVVEVRGMRALSDGNWDIAFSYDPSLEPDARFSFSDPILAVDNVFVVAEHSALRTNSEVERVGVRVSVAAGNSPDRYLSARGQATLVRRPTVPEAVALLVSGEVDAFAGSREAAARYLAQGYRVLPEPFLVARLAIAIATPEIATCVRDAVEEARRSGLIERSAAGLPGVRVPSGK